MSEELNKYQEQYRKWKNLEVVKEEVSEERYYDMLGVLPPERQKGFAFLVGEPVMHDETGYPLFDLYYEEEGKYYFGGLMSTKEFDSKSFRKAS